MTKTKWYSPQLSREIVSRLYFKAKAEGIPMTVLANTIIQTALGPEQPGRTSTKYGRGFRPRVPSKRVLRRIG